MRRNTLALMAGITLALVSFVQLSQAQLPPAGPPSRTEAALTRGPAGDDWLATLREFDEWASVQKIYDANQIKGIRERLIDKASKLSGSDYYNFLEDLKAKLKVLMSAEAREARKWLGETLAVASDRYAKQLKSEFPDVANLSASQIQERLDEFEDKQANRKRVTASEQAIRKFEVDQALTDERRQEDANLQLKIAAENNAGKSYNNVNAGGYHPGGVYRNTRTWSPYRGNGIYGIYGPAFGGYRW